MQTFLSKTINMMFLPIVLTIFYSIFLVDGSHFIPSAEASIEGSACSQNGIIEKHDDKLLCMCNGSEVRQDQYCKKGIIYSVKYDLIEIVINSGNDSPKQSIHREPGPLPVKSIASTYKSPQPASATRAIQSVEKESPPAQSAPSTNQCVPK